jgi:hypothetical protein
MKLEQAAINHLLTYLFRYITTFDRKLNLNHSVDSIISQWLL